jgi:hypothetical protein
MSGCTRENELQEVREFTFVVYPDARYLGQLTGLTREAHQLVNPGVQPPRVAIYDTEDSLETVARFYVRAYGYEDIADHAPSPPAAAPPAYYRSGDLAADVNAIAPLIPRLSIQKIDISRARGQYRAVEVAARTHRPRVTLQRPYFDVTVSRVLDRTLILMAE